MSSIVSRIENKVAYITINRPEADNRLDLVSINKLMDLFENLAYENLQLLVLSSSGPDFCLGWDGEETLNHIRQSGMSNPANMLASLDFPTLVLLQGRCQDIGLELAMAADMRWATPDTTFAFHYASRGVFPVWGATQRLPRLVGHSFAMQWLLSGQTIDAQTALQRGLISRIGEMDSFQDYISEMVEMAPWALRSVKEAVHKGMDLTLPQAIQLEADLYSLLQTTEDRKIGVESFLNKRKAPFRGL